MSIPFLIRAIQYVAELVLVFELFYALSQRPSELQKHVVMLIIACLFMFIGYNIELEASNLQEALTGTAVSYIGKPYVMLFSATFIASFFGKKIDNKIFVPCAIFCSIFCLLIFYNDNLHLYYEKTEYVLGKFYSPLVITRGPLYYLYMATTIVFFISCIVLIFDGTRKVKSKEKKKLSNLLILMVLSGIGGYLVFLNFDTHGYDATMAGVFGGVLCLFILFIRYKIFDVVQLAQEKALMESNVGLIVIDSVGEVVYMNDLGEQITKLISVDEILKTEGDDNNFHVKDKVYSVIKKDIVFEKTYYGKSIEITDITVSFNYQSKLESEVKTRTEKIENIQKEVIGSFASIVEARSVETGEHIIRTKEYVDLTARALRRMGKYQKILTNDYINQLTSATPLHDIGKISVSDSILNKPGKLTEEEYNVMKTHTTAGALVIEKTMRGLEDDEYVELSKTIALHHHEWFDGSGYPDGLKGTDIPLAARIVAIADTYDALINERCYKPAYTREEAIQILKEETGTHFDPDIVNAFIGEI